MTLVLTKPNKLKENDTVATVSLSWGGPSLLPDRYNIGVKQLEDAFNVKVMPMLHTLSDDNWNYNNPAARAKDLMDAFLNPDIKAIISTIGGDETIRLLPYVDFDIIRNNPKIFMGYSDTTVNHFMCLHAGLSSFYGPSIMAGFGENCGLHQFLKSSVKKTLFSDEIIGKIEPAAEGWTNEILDWANPENQNIKRKLKPSRWNFLQGDKKVQGHLIGGCMETIEQIKGTILWPDKEVFNGAILFFETCNSGILKNYLEYMLRNYCATGIAQICSGMIFGRPAGVNDANGDFEAFDNIVKTVLAEYGLSNLPVITQMDFGHTDPMFVIPYGAMAEIDPINQTFIIKDNGVK